LKQLGSEPVIVATVGEDAQPYFDRLGALGISREGIAVLPGEYTAQAFITTDLDDNQITAFHPGAMASSHRNPVAGKMNGQWAIVAPDGLEGMIAHCAALAEAGIPFAFDPGQALPLFPASSCCSAWNRHGSAPSMITRRSSWRCARGCRWWHWPRGSRLSS